MLFELLFKMLEDCGDDTEARVDIVNEKPLAVWFGATKSLRQLGYSGRNLRAARREVIEEINNAEPETVKAFCEGGPSALVNA